MLLLDGKIVAWKFVFLRLFWVVVKLKCISLAILNISNWVLSMATCTKCPNHVYTFQTNDIEAKIFSSESVRYL